MLTLDPFRYYRRRRRLMREAQDEAQHLRLHYGDEALAMARQKSTSPGRTRWGRRVIVEAAKILRKEMH